MKVLQINATYGIGSTGEIACGIGKTAERCGIDVYYACGDVSPQDNGDRIFTIGNPLDHRFHALYSRIFGSQGKASYFATKQLLRRMSKIKPDIFHLHNLHNNYINYPLLFKYIQKNQINTVITLHDCWFFTGKCCHFVYDGCEKWKTTCGKCPRLKKEIPSYFFDRSSRDLALKKKLIGTNPYVHIVGCSNWITDLCKQSVLSKRVVGTIYNGIDTKLYYPRKTDLRMELGLQGKYVMLGMAGKWLSEENVETYSAFMDSLYFDEVLLLVGCTPAQIADLPRGVVGVPFIRDKDTLAAYYSVADVFINVTKADTLPTVNMEALACGTPVITYDSGGCPEIISDDVGAVVPYGDYEELIKCKNRVRRFGKERYTVACIQRVEKCFAKETNFLKYIELYQTIVH